MSLPSTYDFGKIDLELIHDDHQELERRLEAVRHAVAQDTTDGLIEALERLRDYALTHYGLEESMMMSSRYPHIREHARMHQRLLGILNRAIHRRRQTSDAPTRETVEGIEELHYLHVSTDDAQFGQWLSGKVV